MEPILWDRHQTPSFPSLSGEHKEAVFSQDLEQVEHYHDEIFKDVTPILGDERGPHAGVKSSRKRIAELKKLFPQDKDLQLRIDKADHEIAEAEVSKNLSDYSVAIDEIRELRLYASRDREARKLGLRRSLMALGCRACGYTERRIDFSVQS